MRINANLLKTSETFKNVEKDLAYIAQKIYEDEPLLKLLTLKEKQLEPLTQKEKKEILNNNIRIVPKIANLDFSNESYIVIHFNEFMPNEENPEYRDKFLIFDIICNFDTWNMGDFKLRPYQIAGRLDMLFDNKGLSSSYSINFLNGGALAIDDEIAGLTLVYNVLYNKDEDRVD
jgi:hypothetical protein